jgi:hypothetical protein
MYELSIHGSVLLRMLGDVSLLGFDRHDERVALGVTPHSGGVYRVALIDFLDGKVRSLHAMFFSDTSTDPWAQTPEAPTIPSGVPTVLTLPCHEVFIEQLRLPTSDPAQIARMVANEAMSYSPWPEEEQRTGYRLESVDEEGYSNLLLFGVRQSVLDTHLAALHKFKLYPTHIEASTISLARLLSFAEEEERPAALLLEEGRASYVRLSHGRYAYSRGTLNNTAASDFARRSLAMDVRKNGRHAAPTSMALLDCRKPNAEALQDIELENMPMFEASRLGAAVLNGAGALDQRDALCLGAALAASESSDTANLLPDRERMRMTLREVFRQGKVLALLLVWFAAAIIGLGYYSIESMQTRTEQAELAIATLEKDAGDLRDQSKALELLSGERIRVSGPLKLVLELYRVTPRDIAINSMQYDARGRVVLGGEALQYRSVYSFVGALQESPLFRTAEISNASKPPNSNVDAMVEFKMICTVAR